MQNPSVNDDKMVSQTVHFHESSAALAGAWPLAIG
jgi:hypothetical protein